MASGQHRSGSETVAGLGAAFAATGAFSAADVWRAGDAAASGAATPVAGVLSKLSKAARGAWQADEGGVHTGFAALDAAFPHRGWPCAGLTELLCDACGIGELRLLAPALTALCRNEARSIALVTPPFVPYPPALRDIGVDVAKMLLIRPRSQREALWAMRQALATGACSAVLGWLPETSLGFANLRLLLLAARQGEAWGSLFRPAQAAESASAAELRLRLSPRPSGRLRVDIVKRRGGWPLSGIELDVGTQGALGWRHAFGAMRPIAPAAPHGAAAERHPHALAAAPRRIAGAGNPSA